MLTKDEHVLEVCSEETLGQIRARYLSRNAHAHSYTWKHLRRVLDMNKTLEGFNTFHYSHCFLFCHFYRKRYS